MKRANKTFIHNITLFPHAYNQTETTQLITNFLTYNRKNLSIYNRLTVITSSC